MGKDGIILDKEEIIETNKAFNSGELMNESLDSLEYFTRYIKYPDGTLEELKVPKEEVKKQILKAVKRDKEMLNILKRL